MTEAPGFNRRWLLGAAAASAAAGPLEALGLSRRNDAMTDMLTEAPEQTNTDKAAIRPFTVKPVSDGDLAELRRRINATRWPERELVDDDTQGVQLATMQKLARYWGSEYDWRKCEATLQALPHYLTEIDGLD